MGWFDDIVDFGSEVLPIGLSVAGAATGNPWLIGAGMGVGALTAGKKKPATSTTTQTRPSTPVRIRTKNGNVVTMYSHGPASQTTTQDPGSGGPLEGMSNPLAFASLWQKYSGLGNPAAPAVAGVPTGSAGVNPFDFAGQDPGFGPGMANTPWSRRA